MKIKIDNNLTIQVPKFTDDIEDLQKLYQLNFGKIRLERDSYEKIGRDIVLSNNSNWDKAIALTILETKLITRIVFTKTHCLTYPFYKRPYIKFRDHITYIVETLATFSVDSLIKSIKNNKKQKVSTYIGNAVTYSFRVDSDHLIGSNSQISRMHKMNDQTKHVFMKEIELLPPETLNSTVDQKAYYYTNYLGPHAYRDLRAVLEASLYRIHEREKLLLETKYKLKDARNMDSDFFDIFFDEYTDRDSSSKVVCSSEDVAKIYGVSKERINKILTVGMRRLRKQAKISDLLPYLNEELEPYGISDEHNQLPVSWQ